MAETEPLGAIVVVNYGDPSMLLANPALRAGAGWHLVVVDNLSTTEARTAVRALAGEHGWDLLEPTTNLGFGAGANLGVERATRVGADVVVLVNPDAELEVGAAERLAGRARERPDALISPVVVRPDGSTWFDGATIDLRTGRTSGKGAPGEAWLSGACLATTTAAWARHGGFTDGYFLYWEDVDLSVRWSRAGGTLEVLRSVECRHAVGGTQSTSTSGRAKSAQYYYYNCRNRLLFARLNLPPRARWLWAWHAVPYARRVLLRGGRRQLRHPGPTLGAVARGTVAGLTLLLKGPSPRTAAPPAATG